MLEPARQPGLGIKAIVVPEVEPVRLDVEAWVERVLDVVERRSAARPAPASTKKPRHRPPRGLPTATVQELDEKLAARRAADRPVPHELTQEQIALDLEVDRHWVQRGERLVKLGWDLLRSADEFAADDGRVRWPSDEKAARLLASDGLEGTPEGRPPT
jgi:hypothetical protein